MKPLNNCIYSIRLLVNLVKFYNSAAPRQNDRQPGQILLLVEENKEPHKRHRSSTGKAETEGKLREWQ